MQNLHHLHPKIQQPLVDVMKIARTISIKGLHPTSSMSWVEKTLQLIEGLPSETIHLVFDNYAEDENILSISKGRKCCSCKRNIAKLNQTLPKLNEWHDFHSNTIHKLQLCDLLADCFSSPNVTLSLPCFFATFHITCTFVKDTHVIG